jgi:hypothetical protein
MVPALTLMVFNLTDPMIALLPWYAASYLLMGACIFGPARRGNREGCAQWTGRTFFVPSGPVPHLRTMPVGTWSLTYRLVAMGIRARTPLECGT